MLGLATSCRMASEDDRTGTEGEPDGMEVSEEQESMQTKNEMEAPDDEAYVGLTEDEAAALAEKEGLRWRIVSVDGEHRAVTMDYDPKRLNFAIEAGKVVKVTRG